MVYYFAMKLDKNGIQEFQQEIYSHYTRHKRILPWRPPTLKLRRDGSVDPYRIVVSEIMLQQTQVPRVGYKYDEFIKTFPTWQSLAYAKTSDVLRVWKGLGYNRRGLYLRQTAQKVVEEFNGKFPQDEEILVKFPGIGKATASSIKAFAFNLPTVFIETNIRTVFIYFFFKDKDQIHDDEILPLIDETLDRKNPREWYYALMDYGFFLKSSGYRSINTKSKHYTKQSTFEGSTRQLRSKVISFVLEKKEVTEDHLYDKFKHEKGRLAPILKDLIKEGFLIKQGKFCKIP